MPLLVGVILAIGTLLIAMILFRYEIVNGGNNSAPIVYRLDRFTGRVEYSIASQPWVEIKD